MAFFIAAILRGVRGSTPARCTGSRSIMCEVRVTGRIWSVRRKRTSAFFVKGVYKRETGVSWRKIKAEYIAGGISQRALAEKYGVPLSSLVKHAKKEKWTAKRKESETKAVEKVSEKTAEIVADNAVLLERIKTKLLQRLDRMVEEFPTTAQEMKLKDKGQEVTFRMRDIAAVYAALEDKTAKGQGADIEDLSPLAELLKDE